MYSNDELKELIKILEDSSLSVIEVQKEDGSKVRIEKSCPDRMFAFPPAPPAMAPQQQPVSAQTQAPAQPQQPADSGRVIKAPIVGVFYTSPSPQADPFVSVGKQIKKGDTVCIIEAMKCMNEIQAEEDGVIAEVLAADGELVEYGQPLFKLK